MNIKGLHSILNTTVATVKSDRQIKSDSSHDRDAAGQYFHQKNKKKEKMTDEQFDQALKNLNQKSFMKEMNWTAKKIILNEIKFAEIKDASEQIIRTISEFDMWELFTGEGSVNEGKGQLLRRTA